MILIPVYELFLASWSIMVMKRASFAFFFPLNGKYYACGFGWPKNLVVISLDSQCGCGNQIIILLLALPWGLLCFFPLHLLSSLNCLQKPIHKGELSCLIICTRIYFLTSFWFQVLWLKWIYDQEMLFLWVIIETFYYGYNCLVYMTYMWFEKAILLVKVF